MSEGKWAGGMTNSAAIGYMIMAAQQAEIDKKTIKKLEALMLENMDFSSEAEAEQTYRQF